MKKQYPGDEVVGIARYEQMLLKKPHSSPQLIRHGLVHEIQRLSLLPETMESLEIQREAI